MIESVKNAAYDLNKKISYRSYIDEKNKVNIWLLNEINKKNAHVATRVFFCMYLREDWLNFVRTVVDEKNTKSALAAVAGDSRACYRFINLAEFIAFVYGIAHKLYDLRIGGGVSYENAL